MLTSGRSSLHLSRNKAEYNDVINTSAQTPLLTSRANASRDIAMFTSG